MINNKLPALRACLLVLLMGCAATSAAEQTGRNYDFRGLELGVPLSTFAKRKPLTDVPGVITFCDPQLPGQQRTGYFLPPGGAFPLTRVKGEIVCTWIVESGQGWQAAQIDAGGSTATISLSFLKAAKDREPRLFSIRLHFNHEAIGAQRGLVARFGEPTPLASGEQIWTKAGSTIRLHRSKNFGSMVVYTLDSLHQEGERRLKEQAAGQM